MVEINNGNLNKVVEVSYITCNQGALSFCLTPLLCSVSMCLTIGFAIFTILNRHLDRMP